MFSSLNSNLLQFDNNFVCSLWLLTIGQGKGNGGEGVKKGNQKQKGENTTL